MSDAKDKEADARIGTAIRRGVGFLHRRQMPHGEFRALRCASPDMARNCTWGSSHYATTYVVHALEFADDPRAAGMIRRAVGFIAKEMRPPGVWEYWGRRAGCSIPPDVDDTAVAGFALRRHGRSGPLDRSARTILRNRRADGVFRTWFRPPGTPDDVDVVVNANAVLFLGERPETTAACAFLNRAIAERRESRASIWGLDILSCYYVISRAHANAAPSLVRSGRAIVRRTLARRRRDGSFGDDLATALAVCTLLNLGYCDRGVLRSAALRLVLRQRAGGGWKRAAFFRGPGFFGSEEITTAFCVEALSRIPRVA